MSLELGIFSLLGMAMVAAVAVWVGLPLWRGEVPHLAPDPRAAALLARREALLGALRDLDADHADGRLGDEDYDRLRAEALAEGAAVLAALDGLADQAADRTAALVEAIEGEVAAKVSRARGGAPEKGDRAGRVCPVCGHRSATGDRFCASCGRRFEGATAQ